MIKKFLDLGMQPLANKYLTKKDIINSIYMQIGFSKQISENLLEDILHTIFENLKKYVKNVTIPKKFRAVLTHCTY